MGPVYAFWLFSFEQLNGILGSYHVNYHAVSVQVMRQFLNNQNYEPHMWPTEFKDDFLPLLAGISYCKGSLMHSTLESVINSGNCMELVEALPPVKESVFLSHIKLSLLEDLRCYFPATACDVFSIYTRCKAIKISSFVLGSENSKFANSLCFLVRTATCAHANDETKLVLVHYYAKWYQILNPMQYGLLLYLTIILIHVAFGLAIQFRCGVLQLKLTYILYQFITL